MGLPEEPSRNQHVIVQPKPGLVKLKDVPKKVI